MTEDIESFDRMNTRFLSQGGTAVPTSLEDYAEEACDKARVSAPSRSPGGNNVLFGLAMVNVLENED